MLKLLEHPVLWGYVLSVRLFICLYYCLFMYPDSPFDTIPIWILVLRKSLWTTWHDQVCRYAQYRNSINSFLFEKVTGKEKTQQCQENLKDQSISAWNNCSCRSCLVRVVLPNIVYFCFIYTTFVCLLYLFAS